MNLTDDGTIDDGAWDEGEQTDEQGGQSNGKRFVIWIYTPEKKTVVIKGAISSLSTRLPKTNDDTTDAAH